MLGRLFGKPAVIQWGGNIEEFTVEPRHWPLAAIAVHTSHRRAWNTLTAVDRGEAVQELATEWRIRDRGSLDAALLRLFEHGERAVYEPMVKTLSALPLREALEMARHVKDDTSAPPEEREARIWRTRVALTSANSITTVDFLAFDLVRFIDLCVLATASGYLDEARGIDLMLAAAHRLRQRYSSFADIAGHFIRARAFWAADAKTERATQKRLVKQMSVLEKSPHSPWRNVPWSMPLPSGDEAIASLRNGGRA